MADLAAPGARLRALWSRMAPLPGGERLFSLALGRMVPYSGTLGARIRVFEPGRCVATLEDRRKVRNHLGSIHAVALANLGELVTGLAVLGGLPPSVRGIVVGLDVAYLKKARGRLRAEAVCSVPEVTERSEWSVEANLTDEAGDVVARVTALWLLSPVSTA